MTLWALYHRAAKLARAHLLADARTAALDVVDVSACPARQSQHAWRRAAAPAPRSSRWIAGTRQL